MMKFLIALLFFASAYGVQTPTLTVKGSSHFRKPADNLIMTIGVVTESKTAERALKDNNLRMQAIINNLESIGLTSSEYQTGRFSIKPHYTQSPQNPPPYWRPTIYGYEVSNTLEIRTEQLKIAGMMIDAATSAGANQIESIRFSLKDPRIHRIEAINRATANAFDDARALSRAAGVTLKQVVSLTLDDIEAAFPVYRASVSTDIPIEPGEVDVEANVTLTWEVLYE